MEINFHNPQGNEKILKRMQLNNEHLVLTGDMGVRDKVLTLYKKQNIAKGLDTYEKIATKKYASSKRNIEWVSNERFASVSREYKSPCTNKPQKNLWSNAWQVIRLLVQDETLNALADKRYNYSMNQFEFIKFELKDSSRILSPKAQRAVKLLNNVTRIKNVVKK